MPAITQSQARQHVVQASGGSLRDLERTFLALVDGDFIPPAITTATTAELNKLSGAGATLASGAQSAAITAASEAHALNATFSDTEVEAALNALGVKVNSALAALRAYGIIAT